MLSVTPRYAISSSVQYRSPGIHLQTKALEHDSNKKQDHVTISQQGLQLSNGKNAPNKMLQSLMEQKQAMLERRNNYYADAVEKLTDPKVMKERLDEMDKQIEEIETQMKRIQLEEQRKARGTDEESQEQKSSDIAPDQEESSLQSPPTLHAVLTATHDLKNIHSVKRAQITLELEAKAWEPASKDGDFTKSEELKRKAEGLDGKLLKMADEIDKKLENSQEANQTERSSNDKQLDEQKKNPYLQQRMENQHASGTTIDWIA
ncbi:hypothetical protein HP567_004350 [Brevibacillus sp. M2.1A]|uniref:hypothetical protein n=1 Tax=Brevibacillus TaxID=55080 RepID=UPI00156B95C8|nr:MULTISPECIES: hypothetical protein [Brevibacillus]MBY0085229.1 hypothetical protein [Brevibacillus brevis]MCC8433799.1 hypothetical protein [Brevibacillus sp. M2.1A]